MNVIVASWGAGAKTPCYNWAVGRSPQVALAVAKFLDWVFKFDEYQWDKLTLVGHSLGAHISGFVGKAVTRGTVGKIVGLDPGRNILFQKGLIALKIFQPVQNLPLTTKTIAWTKLMQTTLSAFTLTGTVMDSKNLYAMLISIQMEVRF